MRDDVSAVVIFPRPVSISTPVITRRVSSPMLLQRRRRHVRSRWSRRALCDFRSVPALQTKKRHYCRPYHTNIIMYYNKLLSDTVFNAYKNKSVSRIKMYPNSLCWRRPHDVIRFFSRLCFFFFFFINVVVCPTITVRYLAPSPYRGYHVHVYVNVSFFRFININTTRVNIPAQTIWVTGRYLNVRGTFPGVSTNVKRNAR